MLVLANNIHIMVTLDGGGRKEWERNGRYRGEVGYGRLQ